MRLFGHATVTKVVVLMVILLIVSNQIGNPKG